MRANVARHRLCAALTDSGVDSGRPSKINVHPNSVDNPDLWAEHSYGYRLCRVLIESCGGLRSGATRASIVSTPPLVAALLSTILGIPSSGHPTNLGTHLLPRAKASLRTSTWSSSLEGFHAYPKSRVL